MPLSPPVNIKMDYTYTEEKSVAGSCSIPLFDQFFRNHELLSLVRIKIN